MNQKGLVGRKPKLLRSTIRDSSPPENCWFPVTSPSMVSSNEMLLISSPVDAGISSWDLVSGAEKLRYKSCASPPHGLTCVGGRFIASSQLRDSSSVGSVLYWSWNKPQADVKSFPVEPIYPLASNTSGTYIVGGGSSGTIYLWEVASGRLLRKWHAHYRAVTCLVFSDDESLIISGAEDGCVRVWSLLVLFDDKGVSETKYPFEHDFSGHTLRVTGVVCGYGGCNATIVSSSEDRTCKIWSLSKGRLLRNITFPAIVNAVVLDPGEYAFYAGCRDGRIYVAALNGDNTSSSIYGTYIIGALSDHSKAVTSLAFSVDGISLVSGSEDGTVRIWDTKTSHVLRIFKHAKGPISNILIVRQPLNSSSLSLASAQSPVLKRHTPFFLPPPLDKYMDSNDGKHEGNIKTMTVVAHQRPFGQTLDYQFVSAHMMQNQIKELQQQGSSAAKEMELERLKLDYKTCLQRLQQWNHVYQDLQSFCLNELLGNDQAQG